ncbi:hypothetical protein K490DRAFT_59056 [Saccharata proteae CBS 121410]|uniref:Ubiquitin-like protease family profile domain-containing protein n=1 Tax=Saccharata proteae CBS 121410 TaxID=1314787 RepID=A0A9P4HSD5_9PEZI|nr:hypothetical protein K490DRAFT_59056 [Saccharata proteae CBS 121410]
MAAAAELDRLAQQLRQHNGAPLAKFAKHYERLRAEHSAINPDAPPLDELVTDRVRAILALLQSGSPPVPRSETFRRQQEVKLCKRWAINLDELNAYFGRKLSSDCLLKANTLAQKLDFVAAKPLMERARTNRMQRVGGSTGWAGISKSADWQPIDMVNAQKASGLTFDSPNPRVRKRKQSMSQPPPGPSTPSASDTALRTARPSKRARSHSIERTRHAPTPKTFDDDNPFVEDDACFGKSFQLGSDGNSDDDDQTTELHNCNEHIDGIGAGRVEVKGMQMGDGDTTHRVDQVADGIDANEDDTRAHPRAEIEDSAEGRGTQAEMDEEAVTIPASAPMDILSSAPMDIVTSSPMDIVSSSPVHFASSPSPELPRLSARPRNVTVRKPFVHRSPRHNHTATQPSTPTSPRHKNTATQPSNTAKQRIPSETGPQSQPQPEPEVETTERSWVHGDAWINDHVLSRIMRLLCCANPSFSTIDPLRLRVRLAPSLSWPSSTKWLLWPLHQHGNHWSLFILDLASEQANFFNPLPAPQYTRDARDQLRTLFQCHMPSKLSQRIDEWAVVERPCPEQDNSNDCGVFVAVFALCRAASGFAFPRIDGPFWREAFGALLGEFDLARDSALQRSIRVEWPRSLPDPGQSIKWQDFFAHLRTVKARGEEAAASAAAIRSAWMDNAKDLLQMLDGLHTVDLRQRHHGRLDELIAKRDGYKAKMLEVMAIARDESTEQAMETRIAGWDSDQALLQEGLKDSEEAQRAFARMRAFATTALAEGSTSTS